MTLQAELISFYGYAQLNWRLSENKVYSSAVYVVSWSWLRTSKAGVRATYARADWVKTMGQHVPFTIQFMSQMLWGGTWFKSCPHSICRFFSPCECLLLIESFLVIVLFALNLVGCFLDWSVRERVNWLIFFFISSFSFFLSFFLSFLISVHSFKLDANKVKDLWRRRAILVSMPVLSVIPIWFFLFVFPYFRYISFLRFPVFHKLQNLLI